MSHWIFTEEHDMFRKSIRKFFEKELESRVVDWESSSRIPKSFFQELAKMGYIGISLPEEDGGSNADLITETVLIEELGKYGTGGAAAAVTHHLMSIFLISAYGSEEQKSTYLWPAIHGEKLGAIAGGGTNAKANHGLSATRNGDLFLLNGTAKFVINGISADFICVPAYTDPAKESSGVSLFIVNSESDGFTVDRQIEKLGWRAADTADLAFTDVKVPISSLIGDENQGDTYLRKSGQWFHIMFALLGMGLAERSLNDTIQYSKERKQFGRSLNQFQVLQHKMAEMAVELEKSRNLTYRALYLLNEDQDAETESAMAKAHAGEMAKQVTDSAVQIHGGMGYMMETPIQRYWRDARALSIVGGTTQSLQESISSFIQTSMEKKELEYT